MGGKLKPYQRSDASYKAVETLFSAEEYAVLKQQANALNVSIEQLLHDRGMKFASNISDSDLKPQRLIDPNSPKTKKVLPILQKFSDESDELAASFNRPGCVADGNAAIALVNRLDKEIRSFFEECER